MLAFSSSSRLCTPSNTPHLSEELPRSQLLPPHRVRPQCNQPDRRVRLSKMPSNIRDYVNSKAARSQLQQSLSRHQREVIPAQAKVAVPKANTGQTRPVDETNRAQTLSMVLSSKNVSGNRAIGNHHRDTFDSDNDDYTESPVGEVQVEDSQLDSQGHPIRFQYQHQMPSVHGRPSTIQENTEASSHTGYEGSVENDAGFEDQAMGWINSMREETGKEHVDTFGGGESYPPTTIGCPDDENDQVNAQSACVEQPDILKQHQSAPNILLSRISSVQQKRSMNSHFLQSQPHTMPATEPVDRQHERQTRSGSNKLAIHQRSPSVRGTSAPNAQQPAPSHLWLGSTTETRFHSQPAQHQSIQYATAVSVQPSANPVLNQGHLHEAVHSQSSRQDESALDYELDALRKMPYDELKQESFDHDPMADPAFVRNLFPGEIDKGLEARLEAARSFSVDAQTAFFSSFTLQQWEEAGDWFIGKFSEIVKKMGQSRREKRKLAAEFEKEVHERHDAVEKKKRCIEDALENMRTSGKDVLYTPKKRKTTRDGNVPFTG